MESPEASAVEAFITEFYSGFDNRSPSVPNAADLIAMFTTDARIIQVSRNEVQSWSPEQFVTPRIEILTNGTLVDFHEWETHSNTIIAGRVAARWSRYEKRGIREGTAFRGGGQKSVQLTLTEIGWLISSLIWQDF